MASTVEEQVRSPSTHAAAPPRQQQHHHRRRTSPTPTVFGLIPTELIRVSRKSREEALRVIHAHIKSMPHVSEDTRQYVADCERFMHPTVCVHYMPLDKSLSDDFLKQIIGRDGCYFRKTTAECRLNFIWHNRDRHSIEFWGSKRAIDDGVNQIARRFQIIIARQWSAANSSVPVTSPATSTVEVLVDMVDSVDYPPPVSEATNSVVV